MRVKFSELFDIDDKGYIIPKMKVTLGGVAMNPREVVKNSEVFGGTKLAALKNRELDVEKEDDVIIIKGPIV